MSYSDFDLRTVRERFSLTLVEDGNLFATIPEVQPGPVLQYVLAEWAPVALAMNTEKARSEMIIAPILMEVVRQTERRVNLFSGVALDVDRERGLNGGCDFLLTRSPERFFLSQPLIAVFESKREDIPSGLGHCLAAMVAAQLFNGRQEDSAGLPVFGAVTSGNIWRFLRLEATIATIDQPEYYLPQVAKILGILVSMAN